MWSKNYLIKISRRETNGLCSLFFLFFSPPPVPSETDEASRWKPIRQTEISRKEDFNFDSCRWPITDGARTRWRWHSSIKSTAPSASLSNTPPPLPPPPTETGKFHTESQWNDVDGGSECSATRSEAVACNQVPSSRTNQLPPSSQLNQSIGYISL